MHGSITVGIRILEFGGAIGSLIVVVVAGVEDFTTVLQREPRDTAGSTDE